MKSFRLRIPGQPHGQGRPRIGRTKTGRPVAFTDHETRAYAQLVQVEWIAAGRPTLIDGPYRLRVQAGWVRPPSHLTTTGTVNAAGRRARYPGKPDLDNVVKGILDALVAVAAIPDDRHLVHLEAAKWWAPQPGVVVFAESLDEPRGVA
jgi:Holliday junction resolvase RusA-like endonuclease